MRPKGAGSGERTSVGLGQVRLVRARRTVQFSVVRASSGYVRNHRPVHGAPAVGLSPAVQNDSRRNDVIAKKALLEHNARANFVTGCRADGCGWQYQMANAINLISSVRRIPRQSLTCFQYQSTEKFRDLSQHTATSILFMGNIAYVNATPSHKWFD